MPAGARERTIESLPDLIVERHSRNYTAAKSRSLSGLDRRSSRHKAQGSRLKGLDFGTRALV
jgi:hypothetical protein